MYVPALFEIVFTYPYFIVVVQWNGIDGLKWNGGMEYLVHLGNILYSPLYITSFSSSL